MTTQKGFAHAFLIIGLLLALIGALGFVFWQNFIYKEPVATKTEVITKSEPQSDEKTDDAKLYETSTYSFQYPSEGWKVDEEAYNVDDPSEITPVAKTTNHKASIGMGLDAGAQVAIHVNQADQTLSQMKENAQKYQGKIENLKDLTVDGIDAFTYSSAYEGTRFHTIFIKDGLSYDLIYQYAGSDESVYMDGYKKIYSSFKFK